MLTDLSMHCMYREYHKTATINSLSDADLFNNVLFILPLMLCVIYIITYNRHLSFPYIAQSKCQTEVIYIYNSGNSPICQ